MHCKKDGKIYKVEINNYISLLSKSTVYLYLASHACYKIFPSCDFNKISEGALLEIKYMLRG